MSEAFDPYHKWLGIPPTQQPPNHYRLLAIDLFEKDPDVIANAADQRMSHVRSFQAGQYAEVSQKILNEIAVARVCLLNPAKKALYDGQLDRQIAASKPVMVAQPLPVAVAVPPAAPPSTTPPPANPATELSEILASPSSRPARSAARTKDSSPFLLLVGILGAAVVLTAGIIYLRSGSIPETDPSDVAEEGPGESFLPGAKPGSSADNKGVPTPLANRATKDEVGSVAPLNAGGKQETWIDASRDSFVGEYATMKVTSVTIERLGRKAKDTVLVVVVEIANTTGTRELKFPRELLASIASGSMLMDNFNKTRPHVGLVTSTKPILGPKEMCRVTLRFRRPLRTATFVHLRVPGRLIDEKTYVNFEIPMSMVNRDELSD